MQLNVGDAWILAALVVWGLYSVLLKFKPAGLSAVGLTFFIAVMGAGFILPLHLWELSRGQSVPLTPAGMFPTRPSPAPVVATHRAPQTRARADTRQERAPQARP